MISTDSVQAWFENYANEERLFHAQYPFSLNVCGWSIFVDLRQTSPFNGPEPRSRVILIPEVLEFIHRHGGGFQCDEIDEIDELFERPRYVGFKSESSAVLFKISFHK